MINRKNVYLIIVIKNLLNYLLKIILIKYYSQIVFKRKSMIVSKICLRFLLSNIYVIVYKRLNFISQYYKI